VSAWIALTVPAVIDAETVHRSPPRHAENPRFRPRNLQAESRWLLRGVARWGRCGQALITVRNPTGRSRDRFTSDYRYRHPRDPLTPCPGPYLRAEALDDRVWADVAHLLTHPAILRQAVEEGAVVSPATPVIQTQQAAVERQLAMVRRERTRLLDAYQAGLRERADLHQRGHPLDLRLQQGEAEATRLAVWEHEAAGEEDLVRRLDR
jgi:site-specific DNA recombinase